jgi:hypothetical protein
MTQCQPGCKSRQLDGHCITIPSEPDSSPEHAAHSHRHGQHQQSSYANCLCPGDCAGVPAPWDGPWPGAGMGTNYARACESSAYPYQRLADGAHIGCSDAGTRRRRTGLVSPTPAMGQLRHVGARLRQRTQPGCGAAALVPPPRTDHRRHRVDAANTRYPYPPVLARAARSGASARILCGLGAAQLPRSGVLADRLAHRSAQCQVHLRGTSAPIRLSGAFWCSSTIPVCIDSY